MKRQVVSIAALVAAGSLALFVLLFIGVHVFQRQHMNALKKDIQSYTEELKSTPDLDKILTVQNQLNTLGTLHNQKPAITRLFTYLPQLTPNSLTISSMNLGYAEGTLTFTGDADAISTVNKFADTLKFTTYKVDGEEGEKPAFSEVVLGSFGLNSGENEGKPASYQLSLKFDPVIFDTTKKITLVVPKKITTRSETEKPSNLFDTLPKENNNQ